MGTLKRVQTTTLLQVAAGTFILGSTALYLLQKNVQNRVRNLEHYKHTFKVIAVHDAAKSLLGPPINIGSVNLADRRSNYVGETDSRLRIPVSGTLNSGFINVHAVRRDPKDVFKTRLIELETIDSNVVIYDDPAASN